MGMRDKLHTGELYLPDDDSIMEEQLKYVDMLYDFNRTRPTELDKREQMLKEMFAEIGTEAVILNRRFMQTGAVSIFISAIMFIAILP